MTIDRKLYCENCGKEHDGTYGTGRFCSNGCAHSFSTKNKRLEINKKISESLQKTNLILTNIRQQKYNLNPKICPICKKAISYEKRLNKTCGDKNCTYEWYRIAQQKANIKRRFVENGQGRSKSGWYKGFFCNSTYELVFVIYCLDHNIKIERNTQGYEYEWDGKKHLYYPDFIVNNELYEIKGYVSSKVYAKIKAVPQKVNLLLYKDLQKYMNYVDEKYNKTHTLKHNTYYELYDNGEQYKKKKFKYEYICEVCGKSFLSYFEHKQKHIYCSRECYFNNNDFKNRCKKEQNKKQISKSVKKFYNSLNYNELFEKFKKENPNLQLINGYEGYCHDYENVYSLRKGTLKKMKVFGKNKNYYIQIARQYLNVTDLLIKKN